MSRFVFSTETKKFSNTYSADYYAVRQWVRSPPSSTTAYFVSVLKTKHDIQLLLMFSRGKMSAASHGVVRFSPCLLNFLNILKDF